MARRVARLTLDTLPDLAGGCASCVFWQLDPVRRERASGHEAGELAAWASEVLREWGSCGRVLYVDDRPAGHIVYAPAVHLPGAEQFPTSPISPDAVLLAQAHVDPAYAGAGLGRVLVQAMAKDLIKRGGIAAVEAFGDSGASRVPDPRRTPSRPAATPGCVLPSGFLLGVGFRTHRAHPRTPRMRMDLRSAITWRGEIEAALDRLLAPVRAPASPPTARTPAVRGARRDAAAPGPVPRRPLTPEGAVRPL